MRRRCRAGQGGGGQVGGGHERAWEMLPPSRRLLCGRRKHASNEQLRLQGTVHSRNRLRSAIGPKGWSWRTGGSPGSRWNDRGGLRGSEGMESSTAAVGGVGEEGKKTKSGGDFRSTYKRPASIEEVKACVQQRGETLVLSKIQQLKFQTKEQ
jgi:hypothetical protein